MLNKLSINLRVLMLILIPTLILVLIGYYSYKGYNDSKAALVGTNNDLEAVSLAADLTYKINLHYTQLLTDLERGYVSWSASKEKAIEGKEIIANTLGIYNAALPKDKVDSKLLNSFADTTTRIQLNQQYIIDYLTSRKGTTSDLTEISQYLAKAQFKNAQDILREINAINQSILNKITTTTHTVMGGSDSNSKELMGIIGVGSLFMLLVGFLISRSIKKPTNELTEVVSRLSEGEFDARAKVIGNDEIARLGKAFNGLLDDRAVTLTEIDKEHKELNESVFNLLQTVADLSERDLTIRASVTEDATGPVADALNLLAEETADTLIEVKRVANNVNQASNKVNTHLMSINKLAMKEQARAIDTADQMNVMIERLDSISNSAANTNTMAGTTTESTKLAHRSVSDTLTGMSDIRTTVQETGKRIKQLGERSQEISHVIEIIETIAERTTLLALNASMQAAAAGDEGKGFSVIAEEIQRLAESSRDSTGQISKLVSNIQQETNSTIETMDKTIEQVVDGSVKAADAAEQMKNVLETTNDLVMAVDQIATSSKDQVSISKDLKHKAESILKSTQVTGQELLSLTGLSRNMSEYAQQLVKSVDVFKLGEDEVTQQLEDEEIAYQKEA